MARRALTAADTAWAMDEIMAGEATPAQLAAFAVLLRAKGETPDELAGLVADDARPRRAGAGRPAARSTSSAPAATGRTR